MQKYVLLFVVVFSLIKVRPLLGQTERTSQYDNLIKTYVDHHVFNGVVLIAESGNIIYNKAFGNANFELNVKNKTETKFIVGSLTKSLTATLIMKLVQEDKLELSDNITEYIKNAPEQKWDKITIHHLMSNTSGLPNYFQIPGWTKGEFRKDITAKEFLEVIAGLDLQFEPGSKYLYSNPGFYLLGLIVEEVTGKGYNDALAEYIFEPLNMDNSGTVTNQTLILDKASGYKLNAEGGYKNQSYFNMALFNAAGNIYSTTEDILKWSNALFNEDFLNEDLRTELFNTENQYSFDREKFEFKNIEGKLKSLSYNGQIEGYSSMFTIFTESNNTIIILNNTGMGFRAKKKMTHDLASLLFQSPESISTLPVSFILTKHLYERNLYEGIELIRTNKNNLDADEKRIEETANQFYWSGEAGTAIKIFELNAELFPQSVSANFKIAEVYKDYDLMEKALPYYKKVNELLPENEYIKTILKKYN